MTRAKLIPYLLVICIGFMPAISLAVGEMHHETMNSADCIERNSMEMVLDLPCDDENCLPMIHACGQYSGSGIISGALADLFDRVSRLTSFRPAHVDFGSPPEDSIYRPPIA